MADYFVSYTSSDRTEAHWIAQTLETLGHVGHVHEWEVKAGDDIYAWMQARLDAADHVLCVVSDAYMAAPYSTLERNAALWANATRPGFVQFVVVKPCKLPVIADLYRRCEIFGLPEEAAREKLRAFFAHPTKADPAPWLPQQIALSNIPVRVPAHFLGRDDALAAVAAALKRHPGGVAITAVHGLRGVGKTTLAAAYAELHKRDYRATWWIRAQTADGMRADLVALGVRLGWVAADEKEAPAYDKVADRLRHEGEGLLLIYDNAVDANALRPFLPKGGAARVLATSNSHAWRGLAEPIELELWPKEIGADYFLVRLGRAGERAEAEALSDALGGLPLAHEQAAAYCERLGVSLADYLRRFEAQPIKLLDAKDDAPLDYDKRTVAKTFALAIDEAAKLHPAAEPLIVRAALLAPEPIPLFLFRDGRAALGEPLTLELADDGLEEAVAALRAFALVDLEMIPDERDAAIETQCFRLHRLVRTVAAGRCEGAARVSARSGLIGATAQAMEASGEAGDARSWPKMRRVLGSAEALIGSDDPEAESELQVAAVATCIDSYRHYALADYLGAQRHSERALAIRERALGPTHPDTASSVNDLASVLQAQGDFAGARPLLERALAICETSHGPDSPETGAILNNLGSVLQDLGDLAGARPLIERALAIYEKAFGPDHRDTARGYNNLGFLLQAQGDLTGARPLCERALAIRERSLGPAHPDTAGGLNNLASLLQAQGDLAAAHPLFQRALAIYEKSLGSDHPDTARSLSNLGFLLQAQGDLAAALPLFRRALATYEKALGPDHSETARGLNNLGVLLQSQGDLAGARPLLERALAIDEKSLGPDHSDTARALTNLGALMQAQGDLAGARPLLERALAIYEKSLGPDHPETARGLNNLGALLPAQGDLAGARPLLERALAIFEKSLGPDHAHVAASLTNLGGVLQNQGDLAGARPLLERALAAYEKSLGPGHPDTARALAMLSQLLQAQGELDRAAPLLQRLLTITEASPGQQHPQTAVALNNLGLLLIAQGDYVRARALLARSLAVCELLYGADHSETAIRAGNLARAAAWLGDFAGAEPLFLRAIATGEATLGPHAPLTHRFRANYARMLTLSGRHAEALPLAEAALEALGAANGLEHAWTKDSARAVAEALDALGRTDEAAAVRQAHGL